MTGLPRAETHFFVGERTPGMAFGMRCTVPDCRNQLWVRKPRVKGTSDKHSQTEEEAVPQFVCKVVEGALSAEGWTFKREFRGLRCPAHSRKTDMTKTVQTASAASPSTRHRIDADAALSASTASEAAPTPDVSEIQADLVLRPAPRPASPAQMRKIGDVLDSAYSIPKGMYIGEGGDAKVATQLNFPRAWVTALREMMYGPGGGCEADEASSAEIVALRRRLSALEEENSKLVNKILAMGVDLEAVERRLRK